VKTREPRLREYARTARRIVDRRVSVQVALVRALSSRAIRASRDEADHGIDRLVVVGVQFWPWDERRHPR
jgi:dihydrodipicolinate synthase/N-acetylneuraminate lyase